MSKARDQLTGWSSKRLRTKFTPRSRVSQGLISVSPWLDLLLVLLLFFLVESRIVLRPGVIVELPEGAFAGGLPPGLPLIVQCVDGPGGHCNEIVFIDDERYEVSSQNHMDALGETLAKQYAHKSDVAVTIYADEAIRHGTITRLTEMARAAGIEQVNMAIQPESSPTASGGEQEE